MQNFKDFLFILFQKSLSRSLQQGLSRLVGKLTESRVPWLKNLLIRLAIKKFKIDLQEALLENPEDYKNFNDFFTRKLKPNARSFPTSDQNNLIISPADGVISQQGVIQSGRIFQAKQHFFTLSELIADGTHAGNKNYYHGYFYTIYLSPKDYHRVHMPCHGRLTHYTHIPGDLFSVNQTTADHIPNLFARNERVCFFFEPDGIHTHTPFILIMVGALLVASIGISFEATPKIITPPTSKIIQTYTLETPKLIKQSEELGFFQFGSTVILLFPENAISTGSESEDVNFNNQIILGQTLGRYKKFEK